MNKIVINVSFGGFSLSKEALIKFLEFNNFEIEDIIQTDKLLIPSFIFKIKNIDKNKIPEWLEEDKEHKGYYLIIQHLISRHNSFLVKAVEIIGEDNASNEYSKLSIVETNDNEYYIFDYDGYEYLITPTWLKNNSIKIK